MNPYSRLAACGPSSQKDRVLATDAEVLPSDSDRTGGDGGGLALPATTGTGRGIIKGCSPEGKSVYS